MSELIQKLGIDWRLLLANGTTFFIVLWLLKKYAYKPLMKVIEDRQKMAAETLAKSKQVGDELQAVQRQEQEVIGQAKAEALKILQEAKVDSDKTRQRMLATAEEEAAKVMVQTKEALAREKASMIADAKGELAEMVVSATNTVIQEQLDADLQRKLATRALTNIHLKI